MDKLTGFILGTAGERWRMGVSDCGPWLLRWATEATGKGTSMLEYKTDKEALRHIRNATNFVTLVGGFCKSLGFPHTGEPRRGDIGVINHSQSLSGQTAAICTGDQWCVRVRKDGKAINILIDAVPIAAWRVE